ncbi:MAG: single-stranded-DNA-specific exonuclease RecJ [Acidobacteria bacterium RIFCSPLOWO2_02_FULL_61_28]|nr:MAG: single-stranded-DNA-specific exonuclease RecJ [Acidobacteria bacterium RIFCSPLOWO2_02_FULL_61_28]
MRWVLREVGPASVGNLSQELGISALLARLLALRGVNDAAAARRFLSPELAHLHDPFQMLGMEAAVRRIFQAVERREKILIYGDYDVDGAMAVVILDAALKLVGADARHHIPHRMREGYGMRAEVVERARDEGFSVLISVDTGIRAFAVVERARELGLDCIITDHHLPVSEEAAPESVPQALAVLNPKQPGCPYPDKNLCGAGVAFKLAQALLGAGPESSARVARLVRSLLKLVCIGTIADSVPLTGENRVITRLGLEGLRLPVNPGLKALVQAAGLDGKAITAWDVGFRLAPRLNAAGRMESAQDVIDLFTRADPAQAQELAQKLNRLNADRQNAEQAILAEIEERVQRQPGEFSDPCLVVEGEGWHRGVIGIVASRLVDRFHRPALVISREEGIGHGSGRSIEKFHLLEALTACGDVFDRFGGHAQAAGFALPAERIGELRRRLNEYAAPRLDPADLVPELELDTEVSFGDLTPETLSDLERLAPHGYGNPRPVFCSRGVGLRGRPRLLKEKHLKMQVAQEGRVFDVIAWRKGYWLERLAKTNLPFDLAFRVAQNSGSLATRIELEALDLSGA